MVPTIASGKEKRQKIGGVGLLCENTIRLYFYLSRNTLNNCLLQLKTGKHEQCFVSYTANPPRTINRSLKYLKNCR